MGKKETIQKSLFTDYVPKQSDKAGYDFETTVELTALSEMTIIIHRFFIKYNEKYDNEKATMEVSHSNNPEILFTVQTGSKVIIDQLKEIKDSLPVRAKVEIKKSKAGNTYYTFASP